jgi:APA family basic amino acid/polyamine antiporter
LNDPSQYKVAGVLIGIGIVLWVVTVLINRATGLRPQEPDESMATGGPVN